MNEEVKKSVDVFGIAPYGEAIKIAVEKGFDGAQAILGRLCLPATEELGIMFKDKVRHWRLNNIIKILSKSEGLIDYNDDKLSLSVHPRVVKEILENGSWCDDDELQNMWAGLIVSSCGQKEGDDGNLLFANTLKNLTSRQAKVLKYICENCKISVDQNDLVYAEHLVINEQDIKEIVEFDDLHAIDVELDYLRSKELIMSDEQAFHGHGAGFVFGQKKVEAHLEPSPFAIALFVKSQGFTGSPKDYFKLEYSATTEEK